MELLFWLLAGASASPKPASAGMQRSYCMALGRRERRFVGAHIKILSWFESCTTWDSCRCPSWWAV